MMVSPWRKTGTSSPRFSLMNHGSLCSCSGKLTSLSSQTRPFSLMTRRTCGCKHTHNKSIWLVWAEVIETTPFLFLLTHKKGQCRRKIPSKESWCWILWWQNDVCEQYTIYTTVQKFEATDLSLHQTPSKQRNEKKYPECSAVKM